MTVPPDALPDHITAHRAALDKLGPMLRRLWTEGRISEPWTEDPVAQRAAAWFNEYAIDADAMTAL